MSGDKSRDFVVDFVAKDVSSEEWKMVLVESGPWCSSDEFHLRALQTRLYDCIDAALDGQLAEKFPESKGKRLVIQVDCYNVPQEVVQQFFEKFSGEVFRSTDYSDSVHQNPYVSGIDFSITFDAIH